MLRTPFLVAGALVAATVASPARAQQVPQLAAEQLQVQAGAYNELLPSGESQIGQVFVLPQAGSVSHVTVPIGCPARTQVDFAIVMLDASGAPSGRIRQRQVVPGSVLTGASMYDDTSAPRLVEFAQPVLLPAGRYGLVMTNLGGPTCAVRFAPGDLYAGGDAWSRGPWSWSWLRDAYDRVFQVYYRPYAFQR